MQSDLDLTESQFANLQKEQFPLTTSLGAFSDLEMLTKLFTAFTLLGEVLSYESPFTSELLPACTEKFLQQANYKLNQLQYKIQYQSEQHSNG